MSVSGKGVATILVLSLAGFVLSWVIVIWVGANQMIETVKKRADLTVFLTEEITETEVQEIKGKLEKIPGITEVKFLSKTEVLNRFLGQYKENIEVVRSLEEIGENPFPPVLEIKAKNLESLQKASELFQNSPYQEKVLKLDFYQKKQVLERLFSFAKFLERGVLVGISVLSIISFLVTLAGSYSFLKEHQEEIEIPKLLGAPDRFVLWPFFQKITRNILLALVLAIGGLLFSGFVLSNYLKVRFDSVVPWNIIIEKLPLLLSLNIGLVSTIYLLGFFIAFYRFKKSII